MPAKARKACPQCPRGSGKKEGHSGPHKTIGKQGFVARLVDCKTYSS
jgi:hypothetical protein